MKKYNGKHFSVGRKIPPEFENPIDNTLLDICEEIIPFCLRLKITPNLITITRTIIGLISLYYFNFSCDYLIPTAGTAIFYLFDCLDGHLARKSNQVTVLGDYLDHFADISFYLTLMILLFYKTYPNKFTIIGTIGIFTYLSFVHLGLQQKTHKKIKNNIRQENKIVVDDIDDELLDLLNTIHHFSDCDISWTKYFGTGTLYFVLILAIYYVQTNSFCL